MSQRNFIVS